MILRTIQTSRSKSNDDDWDEFPEAPTPATQEKLSIEPTFSNEVVPASPKQTDTDSSEKSKDNISQVDVSTAFYSLCDSVPVLCIYIYIYIYIDAMNYDIM